MITSDPISPTAVRTRARRRRGSRAGCSDRTTRRKIGEARRRRATVPASSISVSSSISTGCTVRTTKGSVTKRSAATIAVRVNATSTRSATSGRRARAREAGDDRRQRERQVDHAFSADLPRKSSRTSTHAVTVPSTAFEDGDDERRTERQLQRGHRLRARDRVPEPPASPRSREAQTSAAIGSITIRVR